MNAYANDPDDEPNDVNDGTSDEGSTNNGDDDNDSGSGSYSYDNDSGDINHDD